MKTKVISIITEKGGVGKTTTTIHLGVALAQQESKRILYMEHLLIQRDGVIKQLIPIFFRLKKIKIQKK